MSAYDHRVARSPGGTQTAEFTQTIRDRTTTVRAVHRPHQDLVVVHTEGRRRQVPYVRSLQPAVHGPHSALAGAAAVATVIHPERYNIGEWWWMSPATVEGLSNGATLSAIAAGIAYARHGAVLTWSLVGAAIGFGIGYVSHMTGATASRREIAYAYRAADWMRRNHAMEEVVDESDVSELAWLRQNAVTEFQRAVLADLLRSARSTQRQNQPERNAP